MKLISNVCHCHGNGCGEYTPCILVFAIIEHFALHCPSRASIQWHLTHQHLYLKHWIICHFPLSSHFLMYICIWCTLASVMGLWVLGAGEGISRMAGTELNSQSDIQKDINSLKGWFTGGNPDNFKTMVNKRASNSETIETQFPPSGWNIMIWLPLGERKRKRKKRKRKRKDEKVGKKEEDDQEEKEEEGERTYCFLLHN